MLIKTETSISLPPVGFCDSNITNELVLMLGHLTFMLAGFKACVTEVKVLKLTKPLR